MLKDSRTHKKRTSDMSSTTDSGSLDHDVIHFKFRLPLALNLKLTYLVGNSLSTGSLHVRIAEHITLGFKPPPPVFVPPLMDF